MKKELGSFVVGDSTKCTGCKACEVACFTVHSRQNNPIGKTVGTVTVPDNNTMNTSAQPRFQAQPQMQSTASAPVSYNQGGAKKSSSILTCAIPLFLFVRTFESQRHNTSSSGFSGKEIHIDLSESFFKVSLTFA